MSLSDYGLRCPDGQIRLQDRGTGKRPSREATQIHLGPKPLHLPPSAILSARLGSGNATIGGNDLMMKKGNRTV